jgi:pyruvate kinase
VSDRRSRYEEELIRIMDEITESVLEETDTEILEEVKQQGQDPSQAAQHIRDLLRQAVKSHRQRKLMQAKEKYRRAVISMKDKVYNLPKTAEERLRLLAALFHAQPDLQALLTTQHRELKTLTDDDIVSCLRQLQELGVLTDRDESEE